jgi:hypothetical protein
VPFRHDNRVTVLLKARGHQGQLFEQTSSRKVVDLFIDGEGLGVGAAQLAIGTYESYLPEITKVASANNIELEVVCPPVNILNNLPAFVIAPDGSPPRTPPKH